MEMLHSAGVLERNPASTESLIRTPFQRDSFEVPRVDSVQSLYGGAQEPYKVNFVAASYRPKGLRSYPSPEKQPGSFKKTVGAIGEAISHIPRKLFGGGMYLIGVPIAGLATIFSGMALLAHNHEKLAGGVGAMSLGGVLLAVGSKIWHDGFFKSNKK